jgi:hypothetical protein
MPQTARFGSDWNQETSSVSKSGGSESSIFAQSGAEISMASLSNPGFTTATANSGDAGSSATTPSVGVAASSATAAAHSTPAEINSTVSMHTIHAAGHNPGKMVTSSSGVQFSYTFSSKWDYPPLPTDGTPVVFATDSNGHSVGEARLLSSGTVAIKTCLNDGTGSLSSAGRQKYELFLPPGKLMGFAGHARSHAAGQGTGPESVYGIAYAKEAINKFQNEGVEEDIRKIADELIPGIRLEQRVEVTTDPTGLLLKGISYQVEAVLPDGKTHVLYEQGLRVSGAVGKERVELDYVEPVYSPIIERFLRQRNSRINS